jgi:HK97 family phage portal protein
VKRIRTGFSTVYGGVDQSAQTALLEDGMTFKPLSMPLADMQFVEIAELSRSEIAMLFKLPASYLNASTGDSLTYATVEGNQVQFATNAIAPVTNTIQKAVSADVSIFPFSSWYAEFVLEGLMRGAHSDRADFYKTMSRCDIRGRRDHGERDPGAREHAAGRRAAGAAAACRRAAPRSPRPATHPGKGTATATGTARLTRPARRSSQRT